ncbi:hypothetical protein [Streptomyces sp. PD-S100-1]|uniref:hypothetical protein n=1 Tax=Streptomyces sp. PD-S100-1 TaxID=3394351 RepID=UPI0039BC4281
MEIGEQHTLKPNSSFLLGLAVLVGTTAVVGCSSEGPKRAFSVPKSLCGVSVSTEALSGLLPASGKKVAVEQVGEPTDGSILCNVEVDGTMVLVVDVERINPGDDSARHILTSRLHPPEQKTMDEDAIVYSDRGSASLTECRGAGVEKEDVSVFIKVLKPGRNDESAMKGLISSYTTSFRKQQPCRPAS